MLGQQLSAISSVARHFFSNSNWPLWYGREKTMILWNWLGLNMFRNNWRLEQLDHQNHLVTKETQSIGGWKCCLWQGRDLWLEPTVKPRSFHSAGWLRRWLNRLLDVWYWKNWSMNYTTLWHDIYKKHMNMYIYRNIKISWYWYCFVFVYFGFGTFEFGTT